MFKDIPTSSKIMKPNGEIRTNSELRSDYPILGTSLGVIGFTTDDAGTVGDLIIMGYYDNINSCVDSYVKMGCDLSEATTNAEKCAIITEFVNNPVNEADVALEAYMEM